MSYAWRCGVCAGQPTWRVERVGDAVVSWACDRHLAEECDDLQRSNERTILNLLQHHDDDRDNT